MRSWRQIQQLWGHLGDQSLVVRIVFLGDGTNKCEKHNRKPPVSLHGPDNFGNTSCVAKDISVSGVFAWSYRLEHKAC